MTGLGPKADIHRPSSKEARAGPPEREPRAGQCPRRASDRFPRSDFKPARICGSLMLRLHHVLGISNDKRSAGNFYIAAVTKSLSAVGDGGPIMRTRLNIKILQQEVKGLPRACNSLISEPFFHEDDEFPLEAEAYGYYGVQAVSLQRVQVHAPASQDNFTF